MSSRTQSRPRTNGDNKATERPAYFVSEAAHYLSLPAATVRSWVLGREYRTETGTRRSAALVPIADPKSPLLSFLNLVELHILSSIRRVHQVKPKAVRRAIRYLREKYRPEHPLLAQQMLTDGKSLFIEQYGELVDISAEGQLRMKSVLDAYLKRIEWDESGIPIRLFPFSRSRIEQSPQLIVIDPRIRSGKPCIAGSAIPTNIIAERYKAGDSLKLLVKDYGRSEEEIEEALRYESGAAA